MRKTAAIIILLGIVSQPLVAQDKPVQPKADQPSPIRIDLTSVSLEEYGPMKEDKKFKDGDMVFVNLEVRGLKANDQKQVVIQADLVIPQLNLDSKNIIDGATAAEEIIPMFFKIPIGEVNRAGFCNVTVKIRDMVAKTSSEITTNFQLSNEILTFHCGMFKESSQHDAVTAEKEMPGITKILTSKKFNGKKEAIIKYVDSMDETIFVIVPKDASGNYKVIPAESRSAAKAGCGITFESFKAGFVANHEGKDFYRAIIK